MVNPFQAMLGGTQNSPVSQQISQMAGMVRAAQNPQAALNQLAQNNDHIQQVMQLIRQNGGDAKSLFYAMAKQKGIDPNTIISQLQEMMK